jgi:hypothetical protein
MFRTLVDLVGNNPGTNARSRADYGAMRVMRKNRAGRIIRIADCYCASARSNNSMQLIEVKRPSALRLKM